MAGIRPRLHLLPSLRTARDTSSDASGSQDLACGTQTARQSRASRGRGQLLHPEAAAFPPLPGHGRPPAVLPQPPDRQDAAPRRWLRGGDDPTPCLVPSTGLASAHPGPCTAGRRGLLAGPARHRAPRRQLGGDAAAGGRGPEPRGTAQRPRGSFPRPRRGSRIPGTRRRRIGQRHSCTRATHVRCQARAGTHATGVPHARTRAQSLPPLPPSPRASPARPRPGPAPSGAGRSGRKRAGRRGAGWTRRPRRGRSSCSTATSSAPRWAAGRRAPLGGPGRGGRGPGLGPGPGPRRGSGSIPPARGPGPRPGSGSIPPARGPGPGPGPRPGPRPGSGSIPPAREPCGLPTAARAGPAVPAARGRPGWARCRAAGAARRLGKWGRGFAGSGPAAAGGVPRPPLRLRRLGAGVPAGAARGRSPSLGGGAGRGSRAGGRPP